jgi:hypothetical protein
MHQFEFFNISPLYRQNAEAMYIWCVDLFGQPGKVWEVTSILSISRDVWTFFDDDAAALFKLTWV